MLIKSLLEGPASNASITSSPKVCFGSQYSYHLLCEFHSKPCNGVLFFEEAVCMSTAEGLLHVKEHE
jgi:hypothetical protein